MGKSYDWTIYAGTVPRICECCYRREADLVQTIRDDGAMEQRVYCAECIKDSLTVLKADKAKEPTDG